MDRKSENRICQNCKNDFVIEPDDFGFYEKIKVPPPTFCPDCRRQRRWAWRNNMSLYNRKCDLCGKGAISIYSPDSGLTIYCNKCWWSDKWDPKSYGVDYDFSKPFFTQFRELVQRVPHMAIVNDDGIASVNCEYNHDWWFSKDCYMCLSGWYVQNVMYSFFILAGRDIMDSMIFVNDMNWAYECINTGRSFQVAYLHDCKSCSDSYFLYDCRDCTDCFMCVGLRSKKYYYKNKKYTKEEYEKILELYQLDTFSGVQKARKEYDEFIVKYPRRATVILNSTQDCSGNDIFRCKNTEDSFVMRNAENCSYCDFVGGSKITANCYDVTLTGEASECYECVVADHSQLNLFGLLSVKSQDIKYCHHCHNVKHSFGSVGLRNANYCILNKQYTKEEYEKLLPQIIEHMNTVPYVDAQGLEYKYGEYYPIELSYHGYNETNAPELIPLSREEALSRRYRWQDNIQRTVGKETLKSEQLPDSIHEVNDSILNEILACIECKRNYKIVANELIFYRKMQIPIPRRCFYCRHDARLKRRNPFKLWHRACMCDKTNHSHGGAVCEVEFETSYAPDRPEIVYCEKCYQAEVY